MTGVNILIQSVERIEDGKVEIDHIGTADQLADMFTKALERVRFQELRKKLGVIEIKQV
jgi:hypothetical protein